MPNASTHGVPATREVPTAMPTPLRKSLRVMVRPRPNSRSVEVCGIESRSLRIDVSV